MTDLEKHRIRRPTQAGLPCMFAQVEHCAKVFS